ncbi:MAG TPA: hypothetical protein VHA52_02605 [Candidatus Babeliaceae bacterium]|nr:hypothetical protein [Candidatus Babeliaceae bacterium]
MKTGYAVIDLARNMGYNKLGTQFLHEGGQMALKQMPIRLTDEERELIDELANSLGVEATNAIRLAIKEALEKRGIPVPIGAFEKKQEGRPKDDLLLDLNQQEVA